MPSERPLLSTSLSSEEFLRWYWLKSELVAFARLENLGSGGDKPALTRRIMLFLDRADTTEESNRAVRTTVSKRFVEPLTLDTMLGPRQAASQQLRAFFVEVIGPRFSYDIHMRTFLVSDRDKTLGDAVAHWYATRGATKPETLPQLELLRFTTAWHLRNPQGTQAECRTAWKLHRSLPVDERPPVGGD
jgi:SAP domain-containing new25/Domain of unknown function (DUF6434)